MGDGLRRIPTDTLLEGRERLGREVIVLLAQDDPDFQQSSGVDPTEPFTLPKLGEGGRTTVYLAPGAPPRVIRFTRSPVKEPEADLDCEVIELLADKRRKVSGWPRVYDVVRVDDPGYVTCTSVVEAVYSTSVLRDLSEHGKADDLDRAVDLVQLAHTTRTTPAKARPWRWRQASERTKRWAQQLYRGLKTIGRLADHQVMLDTLGDNWGLDREDNAVWVDFGV